jgi:hypothetical protein
VYQALAQKTPSLYVEYVAKLVSPIRIAPLAGTKSSFTVVTVVALKPIASWSLALLNVYCRILSLYALIFLILL